MIREKMIRAIEEHPSDWDVIIIGGGATGLGAAVDSASRGYRTLLLEQSDFAKGTSSRSTKLIHGGLRYLQQGNVSLVMEALKERGLLCKNAPHQIHHLPFLVPNYHWWEGPFYGIGLKIYDMLAGDLGIEKSRHISAKETLKAIPTLESSGLRGGVVYYDGQFDDSRLALCLASTAVDHGATLLNYFKVTRLLKQKGVCVGVRGTDQETKQSYTIYGKVIINATGVYSDQILKKDNPKAKPIIAPSQGVHIVLDHSFQPKTTAILVPHTTDKRVLFMVPWHGRILLGTTDTPTSKAPLEPRPLKEEIDFLLSSAGNYLRKKPTKKDILSVFTGLRPLIKAGSKARTASLSRDHTIFISSSQLVTIAGGKWTTYRKMAEDVIDKAASIARLPKRECLTQSLKLHGWKQNCDPLKPMSTYGTDARFIRMIAKENKTWGKKLHPDLPYIGAEVIWSIRNEMARTVEDILARRTRLLFLDARKSVELAPLIAKMLARELDKSQKWEEAQITQFRKVAKHYIARG